MLSGFTTDFKKGAFTAVGVVVAILVLSMLLGAFKK